VPMSLKLSRSMELPHRPAAASCSIEPGRPVAPHFLPALLERPTGGSNRDLSTSSLSRRLHRAAAETRPILSLGPMPRHRWKRSQARSNLPQPNRFSPLHPGVNQLFRSPTNYPSSREMRPRAIVTIL
jgi:hypothetical protein